MRTIEEQFYDAAKQLYKAGATTKLLEDHLKIAWEEANEENKHNPIILFKYPSKEGIWMWNRHIRLIGANEDYFIGLDMDDKNRFKKFCREKMSNVEILSFRPESVK